MTNIEKDTVIAELKQLTYEYFADLKKKLEEHDLVYVDKYKFQYGGIPFSGIMPAIDNDMLEDLCLDLMEHSECVHHDLYEKSYVQQQLAEYKDYNSPKNRILRHMSEIERLKEKYHVTDEDLKKEDLKKEEK